MDLAEIEPLRPSPVEPLSPPHSDKTTPTDDKCDTLQVGGDKICATSDDEGERSKKSCLSLPVEPLNGMLPVHQDKRKLSVQGLMGFADRRRSSGAFLSELTRKMSITNSDGFGSRSPGGVGNNAIVLRLFYYYYCWCCWPRTNGWRGGGNESAQVVVKCPGSNSFVQSCYIKLQFCYNPHRSLSLSLPCCPFSDARRDSVAHPSLVEDDQVRRVLGCR